MLDWILKSPKLEYRAEAAAKQMRYFRLFGQRGSFDDLRASAERAGFKTIYEDASDASFQWEADGDHPDFTFHVSLDEREAISTIARSCSGTIFGLIMTSLASEAMISIEKAGPLEEHELGRHAHQFRTLMLTFDDFDDGIERFVRRARLDPSFTTARFQ